jgi:hypothetical protein
MAVSDSERKIDKLKKDNEELRARLHELSIDTAETGISTGSGNALSSTDEEIIEMNNVLGNQ